MNFKFEENEFAHDKEKSVPDQSGASLDSKSENKFFFEEEPLAKKEEPKGEASAEADIESLSFENVDRTLEDSALPEVTPLAMSEQPSALDSSQPEENIPEGIQEAVQEEAEDSGAMPIIEETQPSAVEPALPLDEGVGEQPSDAASLQETAGEEEKKAPNRKKKIVLIVLSALLALLLIIGGTGIALFFHYYNQLNVQGREDVDAEERKIRLYDAETDQHYNITIRFDNLTDEEIELVDAWYVQNKELVISVPMDPAAMNEQEHEAFVKLILQELYRLKNGGGENRLVILLHNSKDGKDYTLEINSKLIAEGEDYVSIMEYIESKSDLRLTVSFDGDLSSLTEAQEKELYVLIAKTIRNLNRASFAVKLKDAAGGEEILFTVYVDEVSEEQGRVLSAVQVVLILEDLPKDIEALDAEQRAQLIARVVAKGEDSLVLRYTLCLRDPDSGSEYSFVIKRTELTEAQLATIVKQIDRGVLDLKVTTDPETMDEAQRMQLIEDVLTAIERLDNPPKVYQLTVTDRKTGKQYVLQFDETEVSDVQLVELLTAIGLEQTVILAVEKAPQDMSDAEKKAFVDTVVEAIQRPLCALPLIDKNSKKQYTLYFYEDAVALDRLSYLKQQIASGAPLTLAVSKAPDDMTEEELELLYKNIVAIIKGEQVIEYRIPVRDRESGKAYVLKFTKLEVDDIKVFGYLLEQTQRGGVLDMSIAADPSTMTVAERMQLFADAAEAVKEKINQETDPELLNQMMEHLNSIAKNPVQHTQDIYNVLLVGTDERDQYDAQNSDTMILVTINYKDETITMTSLMRDVHVNVKYMSGGKDRELETKLNAAYAIGGIKTLTATIESHFGLKIDNYVKVNWASFIKVFEVLGSVKVNVKDNNKGKDDLETLNDILKDNCNLFNYNYESNKLTQYGEQYLNPVQLLAFVRYRTGDADFGRTTRQRQALLAVYNKFKSSSLLKINEVVETILPLLTTDLSEGNCASLLLKFPSIVGFKVQQHRFPGEKEYTNAKGDLWPDWQKALSSMYKTAYGSLCPEQYK